LEGDEVAIIRPSGAVGAISGNLGGCNFVQGRNGPYVRRRIVRTDKKTALQLAQRNSFKSVRSLWRSLSEQERKTWNRAGENLRYLNRLGIPRKVKGNELFFQLNMVNERWDYPFFEEPPVLEKTQQFREVVFTVDLPNTYRIEFWTDFLPQLFFVQVQTSRPVTGSRARPVKHWRMTLTSKSEPYPVNIKTEFVEQWGEPQAGEYVYCRIRSWNVLRTPSLWVEAETVVLA